MGALLRLAASILFLTTVYWQPAFSDEGGYAKECEKIISKEENGDYIYWEGFMDSKLKDKQKAHEAVAYFYVSNLKEEIRRLKSAPLGFIENRCTREIRELKKLIFLRSRYSPRWFSASSAKVCLNALKKICANKQELQQRLLKRQ